MSLSTEWSKQIYIQILSVRQKKPSTEDEPYSVQYTNRKCILYTIVTFTVTYYFLFLCTIPGYSSASWKRDGKTINLQPIDAQAPQDYNFFLQQTMLACFGYLVPTKNYVFRNCLDVNVYHKCNRKNVFFLANNHCYRFFRVLKLLQLKFSKM